MKIVLGYNCDSLELKAFQVKLVHQRLRLCNQIVAEAIVDAAMSHMIWD